MIKFFIPGYYLLYSRLKRKSEIVSLLVIYPLYIGMLLFNFTDIEIGKLVILFITAWFAWIAVYETGYFENDAITIKKEVNPTLRMPSHEITWVQQNFMLLHLVRFLMAFGFLGLLLWLSDNVLTNTDLLSFVICIFVARVFFYFHNSIRSRWNILTYVLLSSTKYLSLFFLFHTHLLHTPELFYCVLLTFPLPRTLEHAAKTKYGLEKIQNLIGNLDQFRFKYYLLGFLISLSLYYFEVAASAIVFVVSFGYFLFFRASTFLITKFGLYNRTLSKAHRK